MRCGDTTCRLSDFNIDYAYYYCVELESDDHAVSQLVAAGAEDIVAQPVCQKKKMIKRYPTIEIFSALTQPNFMFERDLKLGLMFSSIPNLGHLQKHKIRIADGIPIW